MDSSPWAIIFVPLRGYFAPIGAFFCEMFFIDAPLDLSMYLGFAMLHRMLAPDDASADPVAARRALAFIFADDDASNSALTVFPPLIVTDEADDASNSVFSADSVPIVSLEALAVSDSRRGVSIFVIFADAADDMSMLTDSDAMIAGAVRDAAEDRSISTRSVLIGPLRDIAAAASPSIPQRTGAVTTAFAT